MDEIELSKLQLSAGDTLVAKSSIQLTAVQAKEISDKLRAIVPDGVKVVLIAWPLSLEVQTQDGKTSVV